MTGVQTCALPISEETAAGKKTNVTAYTKPDGKRLSELMGEVNARYSIGLEQRTAERPRPGDDDGSFVLAGYPAAVINIGSFPYGDPNYHAEGDIPESCDIENAAMTVQATLAAVVTIDQELRATCRLIRHGISLGNHPTSPRDCREAVCWKDP